eukprot:TRINITY_DN8408_c0_g1_i1.p1 TRINITY_DN8408_c0_g1~~TRINITY_DN8408_c0_g1_i1.p1  ORF type:complete len:301 (-),score=9.46 TRINITY_DN8408_c0_g1_i1:494-1396(-)
MKDLFLKKHLPMNTFPARSTIIASYLPKLYQECMDYTKVKYASHYYCLIVDETKDCKSRCIVNVIAYFVESKDYILLNTSFDEGVDSGMVVKVLNETVADHNFFWDHCLAIATDNAEYMVKASKTIKQECCTYKMLSPCVQFSHGQSSKFNFIRLLQKSDTCWRKFTKKNSGAQTLYTKFISDHGKAVKMMPQLVKTRQLPFWEACLYLKEYLPIMKQFICEFSEKYSLSTHFQQTRDLLIHEYNSTKELLLYYLVDQAEDYIKAIKVFESTGPVNHLLEDVLNLLLTKYKMGKFLGCSF